MKKIQKKTKTPVTFEVQIDSFNNSTWQGKLLTREQTITFKSDLELLLAINHLLCEDESPCQWRNLS